MIFFPRWDTKIPPNMRPAKFAFEKYAHTGALSAVYGNPLRNDLLWGGGGG